MFKRFKDWSEKRLRLSQIKVLYQNQAAIEYLSDQFDTLGQVAGSATKIVALQDIQSYKLATNDAIFELSLGRLLSERDSKDIVSINKALRAYYSSIMDGEMAAKARFGQIAGEQTAFEKRFMPAVGWDKFGDAEWDIMTSKARDQF